MHAQREAWSLVSLKGQPYQKEAESELTPQSYSHCLQRKYFICINVARTFPVFLKRYLFSSVLIRWQVLSWRSSTKDLSRHQEFQKNCHTMLLETVAGWGDHIDSWSVSQAALEMQHRITTDLNKIWIIQSRKQREDISPIPSATFLPCTLKIKVNLTLAR